MKKQLLTLAMTVAAMTASAQVVLWDGSEKEIGSDGGFWDRAEPTVISEEGNSVMKFTTKANPGGWELEQCNFALPLNDVDFKGLRRLTMRIKMGIKHNVKVKIVKDGDGGYGAERWFWCGNENQWNILTFEFAAGPESDKLQDTGNTVLEIWPFEDGNDALNNIGQTIYIDDIKVEGPMVDGKAVRTYADNSLMGEVTVTGVIGKGEYQCTWDGDWHPLQYDDYALLAAKLAPTATKLNVADAGYWSEDWDVIKNKCANINIVTKESLVSVQSLKSDNVQNDAIYTLSGTKVKAASRKGLYISDGKKVIVNK